MKLLDQPLGKRCSRSILVVIAADDRPQRGRGPHRGLSVDIAGRRFSSAIWRIGPGCSAGEAEVSRVLTCSWPRLGFGAFLPHHPIGEHPMLQFRRDLDLVEHLDKLGYDEFWCGEHHSSGWEMIGSPELFLAAAGERTKRIKLTTGSSRCR